MMNQGFSTDVQLINVASQGDLHNMADFPYGMALITAYLREQGVKTLMLQNPTWKNEEYIKKIIDNPAYLYGFQIGLENYVDVNDLVKLIKQNNPNAKIIFGGPFVVSIYKELLRIDPNLDAVVLGEGEYTIAELIKLLKEGSPDWKLIRGLAWLDDKGDVVVNPHRTAIQDMDAMPYAARDGIKEGEHDIEGTYMHDARITTSRGCTSNCTFCAVNINSKLQNTKRWRGRDPILVVDEIEELVKDLASLTEFEVNDWTVKYDGSEMDFDVDYLKSRLLLSPREYRIHKEADINTMRESAGLKTKSIYDKKDKDIILIQQQANII